MFGNPRAQLHQAIPRILLQEPHRRVERRAAPHLQAEEIRQPVRDARRRRRAGHRSARASPAATDARRACVVSVNEQPASRRGPIARIAPARAPAASGACPAAAVAVRQTDGRDRASASVRVRIELALHIGPAVDDDVAEIREHFGRAVARRAEAEQLRRGVDERRWSPAPDMNVGCSDEVPRNAMLVFTPRIRNSRSDAVRARAPPPRASAPTSSS